MVSQHLFCKCHYNNFIYTLLLPIIMILFYSLSCMCLLPKNALNGYNIYNLIESYFLLISMCAFVHGNRCVVDYVLFMY